MIDNGYTNDADEVNARWDYLTGTHDVATDSSGNILTLTYKDSTGATIRTETYTYVSILELNNFSSTSKVEEFAESGDANNPTYQTTTYKEGAGAGSFTWTYSSGTATWISTTSYGDISSYSYASIFAYISLSSLDTNGIRIRIGSDSSNYHEFYFDKADLSNGWNYLECDFSNPDATAGTTDWTAIDYIAILVYETADGTAYFDNLKVLEYSNTEVSGSDYFMIGKATITTEGKTIIQKLIYAGDNYAGAVISGF